MSQKEPGTEGNERLALMHPHAAGLDLSSEDVWAAVPAERDRKPVRRFGTYTSELYALIAWLQGCGIETVAMEATGVYWMPVYALLEAAGLEVVVVNAHHLKHVPGRKSDVQDCQWIQRLHTFGLLTASFQPDAETRVLRTYMRQRSMLIEHRAAHIQHMQKALVQMNVRLDKVVTDITGKTGMAIMQAIVAGEHDPEQLASFRDKRCNKSEAEIAEALRGHYQPEHVFGLKQALLLYDAYTAQIEACDAEIEQQLGSLKCSEVENLPVLDRTDKRNTHSKNAPSYDARQLLYEMVGLDLVAITGLNASSVQTILFETGTDMSKFRNEKAYSAWLGVAPRPEISGGKVLRSHTIKTGNRAGQAFRMAAQSVSRNQDGFGAYFRRQRARLGPQKAIVATAHKLARVFYHVLKYRVPFQPLSAEAFEQEVRSREIAYLQKKAAKLGFTLMQP